jgi:hypothetical protein
LIRCSTTESERRKTAGLQLPPKRGLDQPRGAHGRRRLMTTLSAMMALALPATAWAEGPTVDGALAEALFREAKTLMAEGNYSVACPKLVESHRLDPGTGTLLATALCHEGEGKTAIAWAGFADVVAASSKDGGPTERSLRASTLQRSKPCFRGSRSTFRRAFETSAGLEVKRNGLVIAKAAWGTAMPVDPGAHVIEAPAGGTRRRAVTTTIAAKGDNKTVTIALADDRIGPPGLVPGSKGLREERTTPSTSGRRTAGFVVGGVGTRGPHRGHHPLRPVPMMLASRSRHRRNRASFPIPSGVA